MFTINANKRAQFNHFVIEKYRIYVHYTRLKEEKTRKRHELKKIKGLKLIFQTMTRGLLTSR